ncbi:MAG: YciI family protein [Corynebacterium sp.]|nr:YciI family protein [Corynebacterium sp.]
MKYFAFIYKYNPQDPRIAEVRPAHREFIAKLADENRILGSGPFTDSEGGALIVLQLPTDSEVDKAIAIMDEDPFFSNNLVSRRDVREWNPVINSFEA